MPAYNSEGTLDQLVARLETVLTQVAPRWEIILVNDGSRDSSWRRIEALATAHPGVLGINLMRNYGQHNALLCGIRAAQYDVVVTLDDDLQNPPEEIPRLLAKLGEGYDVVYGTPAKEHMVSGATWPPGDQDRPANRHGRRDSPPRQRLSGVSHGGARCVRRLSRAVRRH